MALGAKHAGLDFHTWVILGDGEIQEGQIWEACFVAARFGLGNLTAILDYNKLPQFGWPSEEGYSRSRFIEDPAAKFAAFGWATIECDGHDHASLRTAFDRAEAATDPTSCHHREHDQRERRFLHGSESQLARQSSNPARAR